MKTHKVQDGQTIYDIALQRLGSKDLAFEVAVLNDMAATDIPVPGTLINIPDSANAKPKVVSNYADNKREPATGELADDIDGEGLEIWALEVDFEIR
jgi:hypothetical protein